MSKSQQKKSANKLLGITGIISASVLISFPALALTNSNLPRTGNKQLLAQATGGTGTTGTGTTGTGVNGTTGTGVNGTTGTGVNGTGTGVNGTTGTGVNGTTGTGVNGTGTGVNGTTGTGVNGTTGTGVNGTTRTGVNGTGTGVNGTTGTGVNRTNGNRSNSRTNSTGNVQSNDYNRYMRIGYAATQQRDYQTALINFRRALEQRPGDNYASRAIQNVEGYIQRTNTANQSNQ